LDNTLDIAVYLSNNIPVGESIHSFIGAAFNISNVKGAKGDITWANPQVFVDPTYNGQCGGSCYPFSVEWPMVVSGGSYVQVGWYKDPRDSTTIAFAEYACPGSVCRVTVNTGMTHATHTWAIEHDSATESWCADQDGLLCYVKFYDSDTLMSSGNQLQFFGETLKTYDQIGGVPSTQVYQYNMSYKASGSSTWTKIPSSLQPAFTRSDTSGTPYGGNVYWDNATSSWAYSSYTNPISPQ
jgi:hypothetical protein